MENEKNIVAITATPNGPFIVEGPLQRDGYYILFIFHAIGS